MLTCEVTGETAKSEKLPRGWKRIAGKVYSPKGKKQKFIVRAVRLYVGWSEDKAEQQRWREAVRRSEKMARDAANWFTAELYVRDRPAIGLDGKLNKFDVPSLYQASKERFPLDDYDSSFLSAIENTVRGYYAKERWEVAIGRRSLRSYRGLPYPIRGQAVKLYLDDERRPRFKATIARERFDLALIRSARKNTPGRDNSRQYNTLVEAIEKGYSHGECKLSCDAHGQPRLTIVLTLPKPDAKERSGVMHVRSDKDALLVCLNDKDERLWIYNADKLIGWKFAHRRMLNRLSDDTKFEDRPQGIANEKRRAAVDRFHRRMRTTVQQIAARVVGYANRRKLASIIVDFRDKSFVNDFNWYALEEQIKALCDEHSITLEVKKCSETKAATGTPRSVKADS